MVRPCFLNSHKNKINKWKVERELQLLLGSTEYTRQYNRPRKLLITQLPNMLTLTDRLQVAWIPWMKTQYLISEIPRISSLIWKPWLLKIINISGAPWMTDTRWTDTCESTVGYFFRRNPVKYISRALHKRCLSPHQRTALHVSLQGP